MRLTTKSRSKYSGMNAPNMYISQSQPPAIKILAHHRTLKWLAIPTLLIKWKASSRPGPPCTYLDNSFCLVVKRIQLLAHKFGLGFHDLFHILSLTKFLYKFDGSSNVVRRIAQNLFV
jgi:hypothetical protein